MSIKDFLNQAYRLDQRITSKIEQIDSLNSLARKTTSTLTGMPRATGNTSNKMDNLIAKIIDLQNELQEDIDKLIDTKRDIMSLIKEVKSPEHQTLLERRYLCFDTWERIAVDLNYDIRHVHRIHSEALRKANNIKTCQ